MDSVKQVNFVKSIDLPLLFCEKCLIAYSCIYYHDDVARTIEEVDTEHWTPVKDFSYCPNCGKPWNK